MVMQQKTGQPVQFEITEQTRESISNWITHAELLTGDYLFKSRNRVSSHLSTRQIVIQGFNCDVRLKGQTFKSQPGN